MNFTKQRFIALTVLPIALASLASCDEQSKQEPQISAVNSAEPSKAAEERPTLSDGQIADAVRRELSYDPSVISDNVDVDVKSGIVELTGAVDTLLARSRAEYIASVVKGVRAIDNRLGVDVPSKDDSTIREAVLAALALDPTTERSDLTVDVADQVVTLKGSVQSYPEKMWAERTAGMIAGVKRVSNDIDVDYRNNRRDAEILEDVRARLRWDSVINDGLIRADVRDGHVSLSGIVGTLAEKNRAISNAWVAGVKGVEGRQLEVEWWANQDDLRKDKYVPKSDEDIRQALSDALLFDPRVNSFTVKPTVNAGVVTLTGKVSTLATKLAAERIAKGTVGVLGVKNEIELDAGASLAPNALLDPALDARLTAVLETNALTGGSEIEVDVDQGVAKLTGTVDNFAVKAQAEMLALMTPGIRNVKNELEVSIPTAFALEVDDAIVYPYEIPWSSKVSAKPLKTDLELEADIRDEFERSPYVTASDVQVDAHNGVVTLKGKVDSLRELDAAIANAYQGGAIRVDNLVQRR